jgi:hypothetical protein
MVFVDFFWMVGQPEKGGVVVLMF